MQFYDLPDRETDETFLQDKPVVCRVVLAPGQELHDEEVIVVKLSDGSKYKGKVISFKPFQISGYQIGEALIVRWPASSR